MTPKLFLSDVLQSNVPLHGESVDSAPYQHRVPVFPLQCSASSGNIYENCCDPIPRLMAFLQERVSSKPWPTFVGKGRIKPNVRRCEEKTLSSKTSENPPYLYRRTGNDTSMTIRQLKRITVRGYHGHIKLLAGRSRWRDSCGRRCDTYNTWRFRYQSFRLGET